MDKPIRIQRKRTAGFNLQAQSPDGRPVASVCRPGRWGNPFKVGVDVPGPATAVAAFKAWLMGRHRPAGIARPPHLADIITALAGKHLACFCPLGAACHADVLLEMANLSLEELGRRYQEAHANWRANRLDNDANTALTRASEAVLAHPQNNGAYHP